MVPDKMAKSGFARWLLDPARLVAYDTNHADPHASILVITTVAVSNGLDTQATAGVAAMLGVTREEVIAAYIGEMRHGVLAKLLDHPDLAELDPRLRLDEIDRTA